MGSLTEGVIAIFKSRSHALMCAIVLAVFSYGDGFEGFLWGVLSIISCYIITICAAFFSARL